MLCLFQGCYEKAEEWLDDNKHLLGTIAMCVLVIQVGNDLRRPPFFVLCRDF